MQMQMQVRTVLATRTRGDKATGLGRGGGTQLFECGSGLAKRALLPPGPGDELDCWRRRKRSLGEKKKKRRRRRRRRRPTATGLR
jgi:hypothetical protein